MKAFNGFQLVSLFAAGPFLVTYANAADFYAHNVLALVLACGYIVGFAVLTALVAEKM